MIDIKKRGRGRPRKPEQNKKSITVSDRFARFAKAMGAINGCTAGEWVETRLSCLMQMLPGPDQERGAARLPGNRPREEGNVEPHGPDRVP